MATLSDYTSGTISLANGSTTVTGTGTLFDVVKFREGDTLQIQNLTAVIASVDSNTQLTLTEPWTGTTLTDAPYRARYLPDGARVTAQTTKLIELLSNGILSGIAELGVEEGKTPVGNESGQYELKDHVDDPNGTLGELAGLDSVENLSELADLDDVDNLSELAKLVLAANKVLTTNKDGELTQSDISAAALVLLKLAGAAAENKLPYFNGADNAELTDFTAAARALLNLTGSAAADRMPYFTGANEAGLTPLTDFARTIMERNSGVTMFNAMGASSGSNWFKLPSGHLVQWGTTTGTTDAIGVLNVSFPTPFSSASSYVMIAWNGDFNLVGTVANVRSAVWPQASGGAVRWKDYSGNNIIGAARRVDWIAVGVGA